MKSFRVLAKDDGPAEMLIYGDIGKGDFFEGVSAEEVLLELRALKGKDVVVRINSNGGDVFEGLAMYNHLKDYSGNVEVIVDGLAASAASIIAMAGNSIHMNRGSEFMIHNGWMYTRGDKDVHNTNYKWLSKVDADMVDIYAERTGQSAITVTGWMRDTTFFTDSEAMAFGFADSTTKVPAIAACGGEWMSYVPHLLEATHKRGIMTKVEAKPLTPPVAKLLEIWSNSVRRFFPVDN